MNWYYALGGQQQGPVDDAQLDSLIAAGTVTPETLVWREGLPNWQPLRLARPGTAPVAAGGLPPVIAQAPPAAGAGPAPGEVQCAECGRFFTRENTIQYGSAFVCATCKPIFVQKLREGTAPGGAPLGQTGPFDPDAFLAAVRERDYSIEVGSCLSRGWEAVRGHFWISVGAILVAYICLGAGSAIPCVGPLIQLVLQGPLMGGLYWFFMKLVRHEEPSISDAFAGFTRGFLQLFLATLVASLLAGLCVVPGIATFVISAMTGSRNLIGIGVGLILMGAVPAVYLSISWLFSMPLVIDKEINFWAAMELSRKVVSMHWFQVFGLAVVCGLIVALGVVPFLVGVAVSLPGRNWVVIFLCGAGLVFWFLATAPIITATMMQAYDDIFGTSRTQIA
jgi:hypothetical protein